ncbi:MAG: 4'-phosphopantetheinyl transferase superfamily protein, partial [Pseudomonadota bacterium]
PECHLSYPASFPLAQAAHAYGRPVPTGNRRDTIDGTLELSLAHTSDMAAAVVTNSRAGKRVGIDIERMRPTDELFAATAFTVPERTLLASIDAADLPQWTLRFWCAKEAVAKALGRGLQEGPQSLTVETFDMHDGTVNVRLQKKYAEEFPGLAQEAICVHSYQEEDYIYAAAICRGDA